MKVAGIFLLAGFAVAASLAQAQETTKPSAEEKSVRPAPVRLTDAELDQITAGGAAVLMITPGLASVHAGQNDQILIIGTNGGGGPLGFVLNRHDLVFTGR